MTFDKPANYIRYQRREHLIPKGWGVRYLAEARVGTVEDAMEDKIQLLISRRWKPLLHET